MPRPVQSEVPSMDRLTGGVMRDRAASLSLRGTVLQEMVGGGGSWQPQLARAFLHLFRQRARVVMGLLTPGEKLAEQTGKAMTDVCATMQDSTYAAQGRGGPGEIL
jgi:hypothetical protein